MYRHMPTCPQRSIPHNRLAWLFEAPRQAESDAIRIELVERVRREIAEGIYETPEKWQAALEGLARDLD
jgi:hypothetical protein